MSDHVMNRREFCLSAAAAAGVACGAIASSRALAAPDEQTLTEFSLKYILSSAMYGYTKLSEILPEVAKAGCSAIDIWPKVHGDQREQLDKLGEVRFAAMLQENDVRLGCLTQYKLGPFGLQDEMQLAKKFGCQTIVTGAVGPKGLQGKELKSAVVEFVEKMKPHLAVAEETGVTIAIENHRSGLIDTPDSMKWLVELRSSENLGVALAPSHLPQDGELLAKLIGELGNSIAVFFAWQRGNDFIGVKLPKEEELLQMPGRGELDFAPIVAALKSIDFRGWTNIFMHPTPRGIPILESTEAVTAEINRSREYLDALVKDLA